MGIRFYCPNGHRLNVKSHLAGKLGICPHCDVRFRIPETSQIPKGSPKLRPAFEEGRPETLPAISVTSTAAVGASPSTPQREAVISPASDPIEEAPEAVWYVRPPSGGEFGPAGGEVMRRWIAEGRVSADSLVWREGWPEWRAAGPLFPSLTSEPATTEASPDPLPGLNLEPNEGPQTTRPSSVSPRRASASGHRSITVIVVLGVVIVALLITLVFVL